MQPAILFRRDRDNEEEYDAAALALAGEPRIPLLRYRSQIPPNTLVVGRYSVLPNYRELEEELALRGSWVVNSYQQHQYIANVMAWGGPEGVLNDLTPRSWTTWHDLPASAFVVKGRTNSRKHQWATHMFAPDRDAVVRVARRLYDDALISAQGLVVREYVPLKQLGEGLNDLPITNEWRTFWLAAAPAEPPRFLGVGYYWAGSHPETEAQAEFPAAAMTLAQTAAERIAAHAAFFAIDVAETADGRWIVVEVNDGQMSGLAGLAPTTFYAALRAALADRAALYP